MLLTSGQGVVVNALLALGFECTYNDFDLCRLRKVEAPYLLEIDVTYMLVHQNEQWALPEAPKGFSAVGLPPALAWLSHKLSQAACHYDPSQFARDSNEAVFVRQDTFKMPRLGGKPMTARVLVRARSSLAG
jgi:hypothetical protein